MLFLLIHKKIKRKINSILGEQERDHDKSNECDSHYHKERHVCENGKETNMVQLTD